MRSSASWRLNSAKFTPETNLVHPAPHRRCQGKHSGLCPSPAAARRLLTGARRRYLCGFETRHSKPNSATRQRVFDQVVNMIEVDFVEAREVLKSARRPVLRKYQV